MKAILEFQLPQDAEAHLQALHGVEAFAALAEIRQLLRAYGRGMLSAEEVIDQASAVLNTPFGDVSF